MTTTTTEPTITHPAWCDPDECSEMTYRGEPTGEVGHYSKPSAWTARSGGGGESLGVTIKLTRWEGGGVADDPSVPYATLDGAGPMTPAEMEGLAAWLIERALTYRIAIAAEDVR